ncbi:hypothetical protein L2E82_21125 [Cichorium intybus]|uniref:Uncharacterized protein n=1 Tax=Cichorium intybus TaxID=13427 RepID=A0ACB9DVA2_CICIN|nr:hypothetical protein L2E82_21125 [Cichorium intybus]
MKVGVSRHVMNVKAAAVKGYSNILNFEVFRILESVEERFEHENVIIKDLKLLQIPQMWINEKSQEDGHVFKFQSDFASSALHGLELILTPGAWLN